MLHKKSQASFFFVYVIFAVIIILASAAVVPTGIEMTSLSLTISEGLLNDSLVIASEFQDVDLRTNIVSDITAARDNIATNTNNFEFMFKYSWVLGLILIGVVLFIITKRFSQFENQGFV